MGTILFGRPDVFLGQPLGTGRSSACRSASHCARRALAIRAMPNAAGVVGNACAAAVIALLDVTAEHSRPACHDRARDAPLDAPQMLGTGSSKRFAVAAEDMRHFQNRSHQVRSERLARRRSSGSAVLLALFMATAAAQAERQAACSTFGTSGRSPSRPEDRHRFGRVSRQYVGRILKSCARA